MNKTQEIYAPTLWMDLVRFVSIVWVIVIHVSASVIVHYSSHSLAWSIANLYSAIARSSVPLFFMVSGALILDQSRIMPLKLFYQKRILKILVPLILWSIIYFCWQAFQTHQSISMINMIKAILTDQITGHLWFMYAIFGLYLVAPILQVYVNTADSKNQLYFIVIWFVANSITMSIFIFFNIQIAIYFALVNGWIGYFVAGRLFYKTDFSIFKKHYVNSLLFLLIILGIAISALGTVYFFVTTHKYNSFFYEGLAPNIIIMSFCWFILFKNLNPCLNFIANKFPIINTILVHSRNLTFGIYFVHMLVKDILADLGFTVTSFNAIFSIPALSLVILCISALIIWIIRKIPFLRWLSP